MLKCLKCIDAKKTGIFAAGVLFRTAGVRVLAGSDAKKFHTACSAAALCARVAVLKTAATIQSNAEDIYAEAQQINEERAAGEQVIGDEEQADGAETAEEPAETSGE